MSGISCGDLRFLENIIIAELRKHRDRIIAHKLRTNVIEMDMTKGAVDIVFDSQRVNPTPFKIKCPCDLVTRLISVPLVLSVQSVSLEAINSPVGEYVV